MKKILVLTAATVMLLAACSRTGAGKSDTAQGAAQTSGGGRTTLKIAADVVPHAELLEFVKPELARQGIDLVIITKTDMSTANEQTDAGEFDVNFFQHEPYLLSIVNDKGYRLVNAGNIHVEPIGAYSVRYGTRTGIPNNAVIAIPNDATNEYRALRILEQNGFIRLKTDFDIYSTTIRDVAEYLKPVKLVELDSAAIIRIRDQFDVYITNTNKVLEAGIDTSTVLFREGSDSPYANILAVKTDRINDPAVAALFAALTSEAVRQFIDGKYKGAVIPAF